MNFNDISKYYKDIESTSSRIKILNTLTLMFDDIFKHVKNHNEIKQIIYLTQGILYPDYFNYPKFRISETLIFNALHEYMGISIDVIKTECNKKKDIGSGIQYLLESKKKTTTTLDILFNNTNNNQYSINQLYKKLQQITLKTGNKSNHLKKQILQEFFIHLNPISIKYIINILLSCFKIGIGDKTIISGITMAYFGNTNNKSIIERAYNIYPDLGYITIKLLQSKKIESLKMIIPKFRIPIQMMLASRIRYTEIPIKLGNKKFIAEYKYDGERVQVHKKNNNIILYSRKLTNITNQYPDIVNIIKNNIKINEVIFEGEIVAMDHSYNTMQPFQILMTRKRKYNIDENIKNVPVCLFCFDILYYNSESLIDKPLPYRRKILEQLFTPNKQLQLSNQKIINNQDEMINYFNIAKQNGLEGIICKSINTNSIYNAGNRDFRWIKMKSIEGAKMLDTIDVLIIGGSWGNGRKKTLISTLYCAIFNKKTFQYEFFTKIGTGFSDKDLKYFTDKLLQYKIQKKPLNIICNENPSIWIDISHPIIIEIIGDELTLSKKSAACKTITKNGLGLGLRFPVFKQLRKDKKITQITTNYELLDLYNNQ